MSLPSSTNTQPPRDAAAIERYLSQQKSPKEESGILSWFAGKDRLVVVEEKGQSGRAETHVEFRRLNILERCFAKLGFGNAAFKNVILACADNPKLFGNNDKTVFKNIITRYNDTHSSTRSKIDMTNKKMKLLFPEASGSTTPSSTASTHTNTNAGTVAAPKPDAEKLHKETIPNMTKDDYALMQRVYKDLKPATLDEASQAILTELRNNPPYKMNAADRMVWVEKANALLASKPVASSQPPSSTRANSTAIGASAAKKTQAPTFVTLSAPGRKDSTIEFRGKKVPLEYIKVLDQNKANEAFVFCGCHALKNAIVALGISQGRFTNAAFEDKSLYEEIKAPIQTKSGDEGDASIAPLSEFWTELSSPSFQTNSSGTLATAHQVAQVAGSSLTMLTYDNVDAFVSGVVVGSETVLPHIASLVELSNKLQSDKPFHHTFVMGSDGHWVTLTLEKSPEASLKWYGLDSWKNNTDRFQTHIQVLDAVLTNPQDFAQNAYSSLIGEDLGRKGKWFNNDGTVKDPQDEKRLKEAVNQEKYISRISYAAEFFTRAGWTNQSHPNEFAAVRTLATFYSKLGTTNQDPRVQKALQVVSA